MWRLLDEIETLNRIRLEIKERLGAATLAGQADGTVVPDNATVLTAAARMRERQVGPVTLS